MALLNVPDPLYNWLVDFFSDYKHCTRFGGSVSAYKPISASIIQGSAIGPVSFVVNACVPTIPTSLLPCDAYA